jgi:nicotinamide riboside transporter PnuC
MQKYLENVAIYIALLVISFILFFTFTGAYVILMCIVVLIIVLNFILKLFGKDKLNTNKS